MNSNTLYDNSENTSAGNIKPAMLSVSNLCRRYRSGSASLTVLQGVTFTIAAGETCAIVGPSGSGKTTLLGLCAGLDDPDEGSVELAGRALALLDQDERASLRNQSVGFVFQNFQLLPTLTALENVRVPLELRKGKNIRESAKSILERVGLGERMSHYPSQLSGGEQQRVALARAFINRPDILFADEPTGNLDAETSAPIVEMLFDLNRDHGTSLIWVTHDMDLARKADRIIQLRGGVMIQEPAA